MRAGERGVALAVVTVLLVATGALMVLAGALQPMRLDHGRRITLDDRLTAISAALVEFAMHRKRLPCPAAGDGREARGGEGCEADAGGVPWRSLGLAPAVTRDGDGGSLGYRVASILTADLALAGPIDDADATAFALTVGAGEAAVRRLDAATLARRARLAR